MAKYLTNKATQATLEQIIIGAEKELILISPYIKLANTMFARFKVAADKGVAIKIVYRANKVDKLELDRLKTIKNIELKSTVDLHAKCYFNEKEMIITSLNLLDSSEKNWEMGIHIDRVEDKNMYEAALNDALTIFSDSTNTPEKTKEKAIPANYTESKGAYSSRLPTSGFCISCETKIPFNEEKPLCKSCWKDFDEFDDKGDYCHCCGIDNPSTIEKPFCYACYKKHEDKLVI